MGQTWVVFLAGLAGSLHCAGMCGGFACALGTARRGRLATLARHLEYNLGRVSSYCFLGACVGGLGYLLVGPGTDPGWGLLAQRALALLAGLLMFIVGLQYLGLLGPAGPRLPALGWLADALRSLTRSQGPGAPLALGALNGLLPCPLVYALLAYAAGSGDPWSGVATMAVFGLGTFPALLLVGGVGGWLRGRLVPPTPGRKAAYSASGDQRPSRVGWRHGGVRIAGVLILVLGTITLVRGVLPLGAHTHAPDLDPPQSPLECRVDP